MRKGTKIGLALLALSLMAATAAFPASNRAQAKGTSVIGAEGDCPPRPHTLLDGTSLRTMFQIFEGLVRNKAGRSRSSRRSRRAGRPRRMASSGRSRCARARRSRTELRSTRPPSARTSHAGGTARRSSRATTSATTGTPSSAATRSLRRVAPGRTSPSITGARRPGRTPCGSSSPVAQRRSSERSHWRTSESPAPRR